MHLSHFIEFMGSLHPLLQIGVLVLQVLQLFLCSKHLFLQVGQTFYLHIFACPFNKIRIAVVLTWIFLIPVCPKQRLVFVIQLKCLMLMAVILDDGRRRLLGVAILVLLNKWF